MLFLLIIFVHLHVVCMWCTGPDRLPILRIDGPHTAPSEYYKMHNTVMLVGSGIGLTPCSAILSACHKVCIHTYTPLLYYICLICMIYCVCILSYFKINLYYILLILCMCYILLLIPYIILILYYLYTISVPMARLDWPSAAEAVLLLARQTERSRLVSSALYILYAHAIYTFYVVYTLYYTIYASYLIHTILQYNVILYSYTYTVSSGSFTAWPSCASPTNQVDVYELYTTWHILLPDICNISYYYCTCVLLCACLYLNLYLHILYYTTYMQARKPKQYTRMSIVRYIYT